MSGRPLAAGVSGFLQRSLGFLPAPWSGSSAAYLPGAEGSETAWTMSVDSASRTLVRNSFFLAPGQPEKNQSVCFFLHVTELTGDNRFFSVMKRKVSLMFGN